MQKYHDEPKQYKGYLKSALAEQFFDIGCFRHQVLVKRAKP